MNTHSFEANNSYNILKTRYLATITLYFKCDMATLNIWFDLLYSENALPVHVSLPIGHEHAFRKSAVRLFF